MKASNGIFSAFAAMASTVPEWLTQRSLTALNSVEFSSACSGLGLHGRGKDNSDKHCSTAQETSVRFSLGRDMA